MTDNRFKDFPIDARFPSPGVDFRFAELGVDARFRDGLDTRFQGDTYGAFNPARLFGTTDTGWFYDLSDMSTLFQEAAGITPVTAVNQPVGLCLDKSGRGNHRSQSASLPRPTYARHPLGGIRNLLTYTEQFDNPAWVKNLANAVANSTNDHTGAATGDTLRLNAGTALATSALGLFTNSAPYVSQPTAVALAAGSYTYSAYVKGGAGLTHVQLRTSLSATLNPAIAATIVRLSDGAVVDGPGTVSDAGNGWWRVSLPFTATAAVHHCGVWFWNASSIASAAGAEGIFIRGAQLEPGSTATPYQRVVSVFDVTEAGQPDLYYLSYDGLNDSLSTAPFAWGTDKATVVAGVRKLSDAAGDRVIVEASANSDSTNGTFRLGTNAATFTWRSRGTVSADTSGAGAQPISAVLTGIGDISGDVARLRRTGVQVGEVLTDQGTGNFGTYQAFFGARAGTSLFFNGREYSQFAISRLLTANELSQIERYTAQRTGVTI